jgi:hypothetical protein
MKSIKRFLIRDNKFKTNKIYRIANHLAFYIGYTYIALASLKWDRQPIDSQSMEPSGPETASRHDLIIRCRIFHIIKSNA